MATTNDPTCYLWSEGAYIKVQSPYDAAFVQLARSYGGHWDRGARVWCIPRNVLVSEPLPQLATVCRRFYAVVKQEKPGSTAATAPAAPQSAGHVGAVGATLEVTATITRAIDLGEGRFGPARLYVLHTADGHMLVWRSTSMIDQNAMRSGEVVKLRGTVKQHDLYKGAAQTVLTRCKVQARAQNAATYEHMFGVRAPAAAQLDRAVPEHVVPEESGEFETSNAPSAPSLVEEVGF